MTGAAQLPNPGDMIAGKYILDRLLGQGGMGAVFAAKHVKLSKSVAIKIMLADASNPEAAQRFINEGRAAANIQNDHVVRVDDVDEERGYAYMVLELLDGEDLSQVIERELTHRLPAHVAVGYVLQALTGVMQAHKIGIVHRDLKPSNLFLAKRQDGGVVVKVLDFGISKAQGSSALAASPSALTSTKAMLGSPLYMSPEQLRSSKSVDHRADIWAMGIILFELITGTLPFNGDNLGELFAAILESDPPPLRSRVDGVSPALEQIVLRCLARKPENRFQSAGELADALRPFADPRFAGNAVGVGSAPSFGTSVMPHGAVTPSGPGFVQPPPGHTTGAAVHTGGPAAIGSATPQGLQHTTGSGWQSTGSATGPAVPVSKAPVLALVAIAVVCFVLGGLGIVFYVRASKAKGIEAAASSSVGVAATAPASALATAPATAPDAPSAIPTAPPAVSSVAAVATVPATPTTPTTPTTKATSKVTHPSVPPTTPATPTTKPPEPPKPPKPDNKGGLENAR